MTAGCIRITLWHHITTCSIGDTEALGSGPRPAAPLTTSLVFWLMHNAWSFLEPANRKAMCITHPAMMSYASLRLDAFLPAPEIRHELQRKRNHPDCEPQLDTRRARFMGAALLSFDFDYGDLVRWLGGEYTNQHRDWDMFERYLDCAMGHAQRPSYPVLEPENRNENFSRRSSLSGPLPQQAARL